MFLGSSDSARTVFSYAFLPSPASDFITFACIGFYHIRPNHNLSPTTAAAFDIFACSSVSYLCPQQRLPLLPLSLAIIHPSPALFGVPLVLHHLESHPISFSIINVLFYPSFDIIQGPATCIIQAFGCPQHASFRVSGYIQHPGSW